MTVNQVRTLFQHSHWNAIDMPMLEAVEESSTRLTFHLFAARHVARAALNAQIATTSGHTCLMRGTRSGCRHLPALANSSVIGSYSHFGIGIELAFSLIERGGSHWAETDSAANQFGASNSIAMRPKRPNVSCCERDCLAQQILSTF